MSKTFFSEQNKKLIDILTNWYTINRPTASKIMSNMKNDYYRYKVLSTLEARHFYLQNLDLKKILGLPLLLELFTMDAITNITKNEDSSFKYRLFDFIGKYTTDEEKMLLLSSFRFSEPYILGTVGNLCHHVIYKDVCNDKEFLLTKGLTTSSYKCSVGYCICIEWLQEKKGMSSICHYILDLCSHLKDIRNAQVHEFYPVYGLPKEKVGLVYAEYLLKNNKFVTYSCTLSFHDFSEIITNFIKNFFIYNFVD